MPWLMGGPSSSRRRPSSRSPLFIGGDTGISTDLSLATPRVLSAHQLPGTMGNWMDRVESNYKKEPSDQEAHKAAPTGFEPVSPP
jgi:hypothetical protein